MPTCVLKGRLSGENRVSRYIRKSEPRVGRGSATKCGLSLCRCGLKLAQEIEQFWAKEGSVGHRQSPLMTR
jgi:hypothetical protein